MLRMWTALIRHDGICENKSTEGERQACSFALKVLWSGHRHDPTRVNRYWPAFINQTMDPLPCPSSPHLQNPTHVYCTLFAPPDSQLRDPPTSAVDRAAIYRWLKEASEDQVRENLNGLAAITSVLWPPFPSVSSEPGTVDRNCC